MNALRIIFGSILALIALFIGGCSLFFGVIFLAEGDSNGYDFWIIPAAGLAVLPFLVLAAWLLIRQPASQLDAEAAARRLGPWQILGGVICATVALFMIGEMWAILTYGQNFGLGPVSGRDVITYLAIAGVASFGAFLFFRRKPPPDA